VRITLEVGTDDGLMPGPMATPAVGTTPEAVTTPEAGVLPVTDVMSEFIVSEVGGVRTLTYTGEGLIRLWIETEPDDDAK
jgi:hypothetical protein